MENRKLLYFMLAITIFLAVFITGFTKVTYSKYIYKNQTNSKTEIASPIVVVDGDNTIIENNVDESTLINNYNFTVRNYNDEKVNEVALKYKIIIVSDNDEIQSEYKLYDVTDGETEIALNNYETPYLEMGINKTERNYKLSVSAKKGVNLENSSLNIKIKVDVVQEEM